MASSSRPRRPARRRLLRPAAAFALLAAGASSAQAALGLRQRDEVRGDVQLIGNTLAEECATDAAGGIRVPAPLVGTLDCSGASDIGDTAPDVFWRSEFPGPGQAIADGSVNLAEASSSARLELPAGALPIYARLYWAGYLEDASGAADAAVVLEADARRTELEADASDVALGDDGVRYQSSADVTALVAGGSATFRVSGIASVDLSSSTSENDEAFSAWWMVVFYEHAGDPLRTLALYDGLDRVDARTLSSTLVSGLGVVEAGFDARLGVAAFDGDASLSGDALSADGVALSDELNPADNFFNSTRSELGLPATRAGDLPRLSGVPRSMSGFDLDVVDLTPRLEPGQDSLTIQAESSIETFFLGGLVTRVSQLVPDFGASLEAYRDLDAGVVARGDEIEFSIDVRNTGSDVSAGTILSDTLASGLSYMPGSSSIDSNGERLPQSDGAGDDLAEYDPATRELRVRVGAGASATDGGALSPGETLRVTFRVRVDLDAPARIEHQATIRAAGLRGSSARSFASDADPNQPGPQSTLLEVYACEVDADCGPGTPRCDREQRVCGCPQGIGMCPPDDAGPPVVPEPDRDSGAHVLQAPDPIPDPEPRLARLRGSGLGCSLGPGPLPAPLGRVLAAAVVLFATGVRRRARARRAHSRYRRIRRNE